MIVAYCVPHNTGVESGIITEPGFDTGLTLIDLYEADAVIKSFASEVEAQAWLNERLNELGPDDD